MNCLVQTDDDLTCHLLCQLFSCPWNPRTHGKGAVSHDHGARVLLQAVITFWKAALAGGLLPGAETPNCTIPCGSQLTMPFDVVSSGIVWYEQSFSYQRSLYSGTGQKEASTVSGCFWSQGPQARIYLTYLVLLVSQMRLAKIFSLHTHNKQSCSNSRLNFPFTGGGSTYP